MAEAARNEVASESMHNQRQSIPTPVKMVVAVYLLGAAGHLFILYSAASTAPFVAVPLASFRVFVSLASLIKALLCIAAAFGLLKLKSGWRLFSLIISGLGVLVLPFYFLALVLSSDLAHLASNLCGIDSWVVKLVPVLGFAMFLVMFIILMRPEVKRAFESGKQEQLAT